MSTIPKATRLRGRRATFLLITLWLMGGCEAPPSPPPPQILGDWVSEAPRYRDRTFEIRDDAVVFGTGKWSGSRLHILIGVEEQPSVQSWNVYTIQYREYDGSIGALEIHHRSTPKQMLRFANRQEIWIRNETREQDDA